MSNAKRRHRRSWWQAVLWGLVCEHRRMRYCCRKPCGHLNCPDCGLFWDEGAEGGETPDYLRQRPIDADLIQKFRSRQTA